MDLTPRKENVPWWTLLRCCNPSDERDDQDHGVEKGTLSTSTSASTSTEVSDDSFDPTPQPPIKEPRVSFSTPVETDAILSTDLTDEPNLIDIEDEDDNSSIDSKKSQTSIIKTTSSEYALPFRTFLFYMVLRNIIGVDYLSDHVHSATKKKPLKIKYEVSASGKEDVVVGE